MRICRGVSKETRGTAYIVYEDIYDAKAAVEGLSGFNVANRYLIVLYYNTAKQNKKVNCPCLLPAYSISCASCDRGLALHSTRILQYIYLVFLTVQYYL